MNRTQPEKIIIGVLTCPENGQRVDGIRNSWLRLVPDHVRVLFVYGRPGSGPSLKGDELYLNCPEAYEKLPEKVHLFLEYCLNTFEFDYIFKTDDDSYIDMDKFLAFDKQGGDYIGRIQGMENSAVTRTWHYGKCRDKSYEVPYKGEYICDWARGGGYFLSRKAVQVLLPRTAASFSEELFEDKMVGDALGNDDYITTICTEYKSMGVTNPVSSKSMLQAYRQSRALESTKMKKIDFGSLRRLTPVSQKWGFDRGTPIDRYYIESFLEQHGPDIQGRVLEIKDREYTRQFGGDRVLQSEVLDIDPDNDEATIIADITSMEDLESDSYDCIIFTQTLQFISEPEAALHTLYQILKPGGTLLLTCPGITRIQTTGPESEWYGSFTTLFLERLLGNWFGQDNINVASHGSVFTATCFLWGIALEEIKQFELEHNDPNYPVVLTAIATKT